MVGQAPPEYHSRKNKKKPYFLRLAKQTHTNQSHKGGDCPIASSINLPKDVTGQDGGAHNVRTPATAIA